MVQWGNVKNNYFTVGAHMSAGIKKFLEKLIVDQIIMKFHASYGTCRGHAVAQLVEALCYKSEGFEFNSRWCHWNFSLI